MKYNKMKLKRINKSGFSLVELMLVLSVLTGISFGIYKYYHMVSLDSKTNSVAEIISSIGSNLNYDNIAAYGTDVEKMADHNIISKKYVKNGKIITPENKEIKLSIGNPNTKLGTNSEFSKDLSKLKVLVIEYDVSEYNCPQIYALTESSFKYVKTNTAIVPIKNEYSHLGGDYGSNTKNLNCAIKNDTIFTYHILFADKK